MTDVKKVEQTAKLGVTAEFDPYENTDDAHEIKAQPEGYRLYWCNPNYRERRGWRGWVPVEYDSEIGRNLSAYLNDPPIKMEGSKNFDNWVRRGADSVLCYMPIGMWTRRQDVKREKNMRKLGSVRNQSNRSIRDGVSTYGPGLTDSVRPRKGFVPGPDVEAVPDVNGAAVRRRLFPDKEAN